MKNKLNKALRAVPLYVWVILFTVIPLFMIVFYAFFKVQDGGGYEFTMEFIQKSVTNGDYIHSFLISVKYAAVSTVVCLIVGYPVAYFLNQISERIRDFIMVLFLLPMWMNFIIRTYAMRSLMEKNGLLGFLWDFLGIKGGTLIGTEAAIIIGMVYNFLPFMILPIYTSLTKMDRGLIEAAQDLGANKIKVFTKVLLPLTMPGIVSGITMVFMPSVTTFVIPQMLNNKVMTIGSIIEYKFKQEASSTAVSGVGAALSMVLMIIVIISMTFVNRFSDAEEIREEKEKRRVN